MANKYDVINMHEDAPELTSGQIAKALGCPPSYVVATFHRNGLKLPNSEKVGSPMLREREICARMAEEMGSPEIAAAIRGRGTSQPAAMRN